jgi:hypothetical protein
VQWVGSWTKTQAKLENNSVLVDLLVLTGIKKRTEKANKSPVNIYVKEAHEPTIVTFSYVTNAP